MELWASLPFGAHLLCTSFALGVVAGKGPPVFGVHIVRNVITMYQLPQVSVTLADYCIGVIFTAMAVP